MHGRTRACVYNREDGVALTGSRSVTAKCRPTTLSCNVTQNVASAIYYPVLIAIVFEASDVQSSVITRWVRLGSFHPSVVPGISSRPREPIHRPAQWQRRSGEQYLGDEARHATTLPDRISEDYDLSRYHGFITRADSDRRVVATDTVPISQCGRQG